MIKELGIYLLVTVSMTSSHVLPPPLPTYPPQPQHPFQFYLLANLLRNNDANTDSNDNNLHRTLLFHHLFNGQHGGLHGGAASGLMGNPLLLHSLMKGQCTEPTADCTVPNNNLGVICGKDLVNDPVDFKPCCKCTTS